MVRDLNPPRKPQVYVQAQISWMWPDNRSSHLLSGRHPGMTTLPGSPWLMG